MIRMTWFRMIILRSWFTSFRKTVCTQGWLSMISTVAWGASRHCSSFSRTSKSSSFAEKTASKKQTPKRRLWTYIVVFWRKASTTKEPARSQISTSERIKGKVRYFAVWANRCTAAWMRRASKYLSRAIQRVGNFDFWIIINKSNITGLSCWGPFWWDCW